MYFKVKNIGGGMYEIVDFIHESPDRLEDKSCIFEGGTQEERAEWGIRKHAKVLVADVHENFVSLQDVECIASLQDMNAHDDFRHEKISNDMAEAWMDFVAMEDWEYY